MANLKIKNAPLIPNDQLESSIKIPTGGKGNYSVNLGQIAQFTKNSLSLAVKADTDRLFNEKADKSDTYTKLEVDERISLGQGGVYGFKTYTDFLLAKDNIPANSIVTILEEGQYQGDNVWDGQVLTPSPYDPLAQSKEYTDTKLLDKADKNSVYLKSETYSNQEVYNKTEVYSKDETFNKVEVTTLVDNSKLSIENIITNDIIKNGAALPFDETVDYVEGAFTVKDGELQQFIGGVWEKPTQAANQIVDESGKTQQEINDETTIFKAESDTVQFPMINVIKDRIIVDTYSKAGDSSHVQAINRAIVASRNYSQASIWFNNHDYELDDTILLNGLDNLQMQFAGGRLVATVQNKNILEATSCNGLKFNDIKILGLGAQTAQRTNEFGMLLTDCNDTKMYGVSLSEITGQAALRLMRCNDSYLTDFNINRYSYAGLQVLGLSDHTVVDNFKIIDGLGALSSGASGYGVHLSMQDTATHTYPTNVFLSNFEIHGNNWDGINSHGGSDIFISKGRMTEVKNGIELAVDSRYSGSYLKNINIDAVDVECHKNPWDETTQGAKTSLASGISIANDGTAGRIVENVNVSNCTVKYANNSGGGTGTSNGAIKFYGIKGLRVSNCQSSESAVQGYRLYGEIQDFSISNCGAHDITGQGMVLGVNTKNGFIDGFRFGNSGGTTYTGLDAIWGTSTGNANVVEKNTILTTSNVNKYTPNASGQLRFKQEEVPSTIDPNSATYSANLAGFKVGDVLRSPTVFSGVLYAGWMCTAIDTVTPSMTWKRYGATV